MNAINNKEKYLEELTTLGFTIIESAIPKETLEKIKNSLKEERVF